MGRSLIKDLTRKNDFRNRSRLDRVNVLVIPKWITDHLPSNY